MLAFTIVDLFSSHIRMGTVIQYISDMQYNRVHHIEGVDDVFNGYFAVKNFAGTGIRTRDHLTRSGYGYVLSF